MKDKKG